MKIKVPKGTIHKERREETKKNYEERSGKKFVGGEKITKMTSEEKVKDQYRRQRNIKKGWESNPCRPEKRTGFFTQKKVNGAKIKKMARGERGTAGALRGASFAPHRGGKEESQLRQGEKLAGRKNMVNLRVRGSSYSY